MARDLSEDRNESKLRSGHGLYAISYKLLASAICA